MTRCQHCGKEIEAGRQFCPYCGKLASGSVVEAHQVPLGAETASTERAVGAGETHAPAARPAPMSGFERSRAESEKSRRTMFISVALASAVLVGGLLWWASRPSTRPAEERLEGALRPGSPEFEQARERLIVEFDPDENATIGANALNNVVVTMKPTIRNFTGRTVNGLEFHAAGLDLAGQLIRQRTFVWTQEIEPNKTASFPIPINFPQDNRPAQLKLELTGAKFK